MLLKNIINPITVFCGVWGVVLLGYSFHAYDLYYASEKSIFLIGSGVIMFFIGGVSASVLLSGRGVGKKAVRIKPDAVRPHYLILLVLNLIAFAFLAGFGVTTLKMLLAGRSFYQIHQQYNQTTGTIGSSRLYQNVMSWFIWPLMDASLATSAVVLQCDKERDRCKRWALLFIFVNLALFTIITGKRAHLGYLVMYIIAAYFLQGHKTRLKTGTKAAVVLGFAVIAWAFVHISKSRGSVSIFRTLYIYLVGCVPHLSAKLESLSFKPSGIASIYGFFQAPLILINYFLHIPVLSAVRNSMGELIAITQTRVQIAPNISFNAFLSPFYYFYVDGGIAGNLIFSFIYGFVSSMIYIRYVHKRSYKTLVIYLLVFFSLYMSIVRIQFFQMRYVLSFAYVLLLFIKRTVRCRFRNKNDNLQHGNE